MQTNTVVPFPAPGGADDQLCRRNEWRLHDNWPKEPKHRGRTVDDPLTFSGVNRQLARNWGVTAQLTDAEYRVFHFIIDQTVGWGKAERNMTLKHLMDGDGKNCLGTGKKRTQLKQLLRSLEAKGFIHVSKSDNPLLGTLIAPNIDWEPPREVPHLSPVPDATPVHVRHRQRPTASISHLAPPPGEIERMLCSSFEHSPLSYDNERDKIVRWSYERRMAVARHIVGLWDKEKVRDWPGCTPDIIPEFADWLIGVWPQIQSQFKYEAEKYPDPRFIYRHSEWLLSEFKLHRGQREE